MKKKIIGIFVCTLMIATSLTATGTMNFQTPKLVNENNSFEPYLSTSANTDLISINIVAKVLKVDDFFNLLGGVIKVNDTIKGKYTYDSGISDQYPNNMTIGLYGSESSSCGFEVKVGGLVFMTNPSNVNFTILIINCGVDYEDQYSVYSLNNLQLSNGMIVQYIDWSLYDNSGTALSSDALPTTAPDLSKWNQSAYGNQSSDFGLIIVGYDPSNPSKEYYIHAVVTKAVKSKARDVNFTSQLILLWLFERFQNLFPLLRQLISIH